MEKANVGIQPHGAHRRFDVVGQHRVAEAQEGIDRVARRATVALLEGPAGDPDQVAEQGELHRRPPSLDAAERVHGTTAARALHECAQLIGGSGRLGAVETASVPAQEGAGVVQLAGDNGAGALQRPSRIVGALILPHPQPSVAAHRPHEAALVPPPQREEGSVDPLLQQKAERGRGDGDVAKDEHLIDMHGRDGGDLIVAFFDYQAALAVAQSGTLGGDVEWGHGTSGVCCVFCRTYVVGKVRWREASGVQPPVSALTRAG